MTDPGRWRLRRSVAMHGVAVVVWSMLALSGAGAAAQGLYGLAVPFIVAGVAGGVGAALIAVAVSGSDGDAVIKRSLATQRIARRAMAAAAVIVLLTGVVLAPRGMDRGFVIVVAALLAVALALFALFAGDRPRATGQPRRPRDRH
jgi:hypothetical protein